MDPGTGGRVMVGDGGNSPVIAFIPSVKSQKTGSSGESEGNGYQKLGKQEKL